jgi:hypothetical protein
MTPPVSAAIEDKMMRPHFRGIHFWREGADRVSRAVQIIVDDVAPVGVIHVDQPLPTLLATRISIFPNSASV